MDSMGLNQMNLDFEKAVDRKQDFSMTLELLCEEFRVADEIKEQKKQQKRSKRKARRQTKANEVSSLSEKRDEERSYLPSRPNSTHRRRSRKRPWVRRKRSTIPNQMNSSIVVGRVVVVRVFVIIVINARIPYRSFTPRFHRHC